MPTAPQGVRATDRIAKATRSSPTPTTRPSFVDVVQRQVRSFFTRATRVRFPSSTPRAPTRRSPTRRTSGSTPDGSTPRVRRRRYGTLLVREQPIVASPLGRAKFLSVSYSGQYFRLSNGQHGFDSRHRYGSAVSAGHGRGSYPPTRGFDSLDCDDLMSVSYNGQYLRLSSGCMRVRIPSPIPSALTRSSPTRTVVGSTPTRRTPDAVGTALSS